MARPKRTLQGTVPRLLAGLLFAVVVVLLLLWLGGAFHSKTGDSRTKGTPAVVLVRPVGDARLAAVRAIRVPREESAVGTIKAVHETTVASKLLARVTEVNVTAGQSVLEDDILVRLDDADLRARLEQAQAAARGARAAYEQAQIEHQRVARLREQEAAGSIEWDRAQTALKSAEAEMARADQSVEEARTILGYATLRAPISGLVVDRSVEAGDTVTPGQPLLTLYDPTRMQLVARVRESLTQRLSVGQSVDVEIPALTKRCSGRISEIVPEAEAASRTFSVKVTGPCPPGIYSGMFGRLMIPLDEEEVVVIPESCVRRIGQLDLVDVADGGRLERRAVQVGRTLGEEVQVLAGLRPGEQVLIPPSGGEAAP